MDELYLVAYQCSKHEHDRITMSNILIKSIKSISLPGSKIASILRRIKDIAHMIEKQTKDENVEVLAITNLTKLAEDAERANLRDYIPGSKETSGKIRH